MTRINCIDPARLSNRHLVAEYRELPRVFGLAYAACERGEQPDDYRNPTFYTLGRGHARFFYGRCGYLQRRFLLLVAEMQRREYRPLHLHVPMVYRHLPVEWRNDWTPDQKAVNVNLVRLLNKDPAHYRNLLALPWREVSAH